MTRNTPPGLVAGLAERAVYSAHAYRAADPPGFYNRHDEDPGEWHRWARRARVARTIAATLQVPIDCVLVTDDPHPHRAHRTHRRPGTGDHVHCPHATHPSRPTPGTPHRPRARPRPRADRHRRHDGGDVAARTAARLRARRRRRRAPAPTQRHRRPRRGRRRVIAATHGVWNSVGTWRSVSPRWPHEIALSVVTRMRYLADAALHDAQWAMLAGPIAAALPDELIPADLIGASASSPAPRRRAPDALAALIEAGLRAV